MAEPVEPSAFPLALTHDWLDAEVMELAHNELRRILDRMGTPKVVNGVFVVPPDP